MHNSTRDGVATWTKESLLGQIKKEIEDAEKKLSKLPKLEKLKKAVELLDKISNINDCTILRETNMKEHARSILQDLLNSTRHEHEITKITQFYR